MNLFQVRENIIFILKCLSFHCINKNKKSLLFFFIFNMLLILFDRFFPEEQLVSNILFSRIYCTFRKTPSPKITILYNRIFKVFFSLYNYLFDSEKYVFFISYFN
jgi:hypothetical protein